MQSPTVWSVMTKKCTAKCPYGKKSHGEVSLQRSFLTAKCPYGKVSFRRSVITAKCPHGEMSLRRSVCTAKWPYGEMSYGEVSYGEKSYGEKSGNPLSVACSQMIYKRDKISDEKFCLLQLYKLELPLSNDRIEVSEV